MARKSTPKEASVLDTVLGHASANLITIFYEAQKNRKEVNSVVIGNARFARIDKEDLAKAIDRDVATISVLCKQMRELGLLETTYIPIGKKGMGMICNRVKIEELREYLESYGYPNDFKSDADWFEYVSDRGEL